MRPVPIWCRRLSYWMRSICLGLSPMNYITKYLVVFSSILLHLLITNHALSHLFQVGLVVAWYAGNTLYNVFNKKATNMIHAHWFVAAAQLFVGMVWSLVMWGTGMRKKPNLTSADIAACVPIGLMACVSHAGSVLAVSRMHVLMPSPIH